MNKDTFQKVEVTSAVALRDWLSVNHDQPESIWLVTHKKSDPDNYVSRAEVLDELIAFGWMDGVRSQVDEHRTMQLISPRKTKHWAKSYKLRAARLVSEGRMMPSGQAAIDRAIANGGWEEMSEVDDLVIPVDLARELGSAGNAAQYFDNFPTSIKRNILRWIASAKKPETRAKRIRETVDAARLNKRVESHG